MSASVADLFVVLDSITDPFSAGMKKAAADAEAQSKRMSSALGTVTKVGLGLGAAAVGIGVASAKMGATFQATMETLHTQAGVAQSQIAGLSAGVLNLAGQVGFAPNSLAEALYHIESSFASVGITGPKALNLLQIAAEGAAVGHADLVDVTNALDAAIASGIPGVQDFQQAMGVLNSVVGSGDMTMQDLANAFSTGALANVKSYGASITDVGAALAVFGDNNIRGQNAATDLRMSMQALQTPAKTAADLLAKMGMDAHTLGDTMSQGGLLPALELLHQKMDALGYTEKTQGAALTELFGKKAGAGIVVLYDQLDRLKSKYPDQINGAKNFADAWVQTKATVSQQVKEIGAGVDALGVRIGLWLIPQVSKLITTAEGAGSQIVSGFTGAALKPVSHAPAHSAFMNQELSAPSLTGWQEFGQKVHQYLTDIEQGAKRLEPIGHDLLRFGDEAYQGLSKILRAAEPVAHDLGVGLFGAATLAGKALADVLGPPIKWLGDFIGSHQTAFRIFADVVLGGIALKMGILGGINATKGLIDLATRIAQFPVGQIGQIGTAWGEMTTAFTGREASEGKDAVVGLSGAFQDLRTKASGALDKVLPDSQKLAGLAQVGQDIGGIEKAAANTEQLSLFETNMNGVVQVAEQGPQQLALFETGVTNVATEAESAQASVGRFSGAMGKLAIAGGVIGAAVIGTQLLDDAMNHVFGVGTHAAQGVEEFSKQLQLAAGGASGASSEFTKTAVQAALSSHLAGQSTTQLKNMDQALAQMVSSGDTQGARIQFDAIATALQNQGFSAQGAAKEFPAYEQALKGAGDAAQTMGGKVQGALDAMQRQQSLDQFNSDIGNLTTSIKDNGGALSGNTTAAQQNITAFRNATVESLQFWKSQTDAHAPADQVNHDLAQQYLALEGVAAQFLGSKQKADDFLKSLGMIKPSYDTSIGLDTDPAVKALNGLLQTINTSKGVVQVSVNTSGLGMGTSRGAATPGFDGGGFADWSRGAPRLAVLHGGEYVVSNNMQAGRQPIDPRVLSGMGRGGSAGYVPGFSQGGTTVVNNYYNANFAGSLMTEDEALRKLRTAQLQWSQHNGGSGWSVP